MSGEKEEPMGKSSSRNTTQHKCECPRWSDCLVHGAREFGGGEPDICEPHEHTFPAETREEAEVRIAIVSVLDPLDPATQRRIVERLQGRFR